MVSEDPENRAGGEQSATGAPARDGGAGPPAVAEAAPGENNPLRGRRPATGAPARPLVTRALDSGKNDKALH